MSLPIRCACGCVDARGDRAHPVCIALAAGDLDRAFALDLLTVDACPACQPDCRTLLERVQDERRHAVAARERHHLRNARLQHRRAEREARRKAPSATTAVTANATGRPAAQTRSESLAAPGPGPALPFAAAAALERARAKAASRPSKTASNPGGKES